MAVKCLKDPGFLDVSFNSHSFLEAISGTSSDGYFPELKSTIFHGLPSLWISEEEILLLAAPLKFALVFFPLVALALTPLEGPPRLRFSLVDLMDHPTVVANLWGSLPNVQKSSNPGFFTLNAGEKFSTSRSFKDVVSGKFEAHTEVFTFKKSSVKCIPAILFSDEDVVKLASPFQFTLVGKFAVCLFFRNLKLLGNFFVGLLDPRNVVIQLSNDLDYSPIFSRRSYYINSYQMRLLKWIPYFDIKEESPIVSIWISFQNF
ncbi:hypothetical protein M5K25_020866 [Dendrobium thyrsiflorum]|uniref:DUF4283 domain-containing protein n=1 Tax=Dendrobium thyrsiflorum TaxID=117978 RepID=A0ABD0UHY0_DENTH